MRRVALLVVAAFALPAFGQAGADAPGEAAASVQRGATLVDRIVALAELQPREHRIIIGHVSFEGGRLELHEGFDGRPAPTRADIQRVLNDGQPLIALILEGSRQPRGPWVDLGLPLGPMPVDAEDAELDDSKRTSSALRQAYRLLRLDIGRRLEDGALDSAVERIEGGLGFCAAFDPESDLLVQMMRSALADLMLAAAEDAAAHPGITALHRKRVLDQIERFDPADPYAFGSAARADAAQFARWLRAECAGPQAGERLADIIEEHGVEPERAEMVGRMLDGGEEMWFQRGLVIVHPERPAAKLTAEEIAGRLGEIEALNDALFAVWATPGEELALEAIHRQMAADETQIAKLAGRLVLAAVQGRRSAAQRLAEARGALREQ